MEREVPEEPKEGRESVDQFLRVVLILSFEHVGQLDDEVETLKGLFIDAAKTVVDQIGREEQGQHEYLEIGAVTFLKGS